MDWKEKVARFEATLAATKRRLEPDLLNWRLNHSEADMRKKLGSRRVDALIQQFRVAAAKDRKLYQQLYRQSHPYRWIARQWAPKHNPARWVTQQGSRR